MKHESLGVKMASCRIFKSSCRKSNKLCELGCFIWIFSSPSLLPMNLRSSYAVKCKRLLNYDQLNNLNIETLNRCGQVCCYKRDRISDSQGQFKNRDNIFVINLVRPKLRINEMSTNGPNPTTLLRPFTACASNRQERCWLENGGFLSPIKNCRRLVAAFLHFVSRVFQIILSGSARQLKF